MRERAKIAVKVLAIVVGLGVLYMALWGTMYGSREWCHTRLLSSAGFQVHCNLRTWVFPVSMLTLVITVPILCAHGVPTAGSEGDKCDGCMYAFGFVGAMTFWLLSILFYSPVLMSDFQHFTVEELSLSQVPGTGASAVWLTDHDSVHVETSLIAETNGACKSGKSSDCKRFSKICIAPIVRNDYWPTSPGGGGIVGFNVSNTSQSLAHLPPVLAWAVAETAGQHCLKLGTREVDPAFAASEHMRQWQAPSRGLYVKPGEEAFSTARDNAAVGIRSGAQVAAGIGAARVPALPPGRIGRYRVTAKTAGSDVHDYFEGLGLRSDPGALFVSWPADPRAIKEDMRAKMDTATSALTAFGTAFFGCIGLGLALLAAGDVGDGGALVGKKGAVLCMAAALVVLVIATIYRASMLPGL